MNTVDVARSPNGDPNCPICPVHATIGIDGSRLRPAYSVHVMNYPVYHPFYKCHTRPNVTDNPETVTLRLRAVMEDARVNTFPPAVTPAAIDNVTNMLLHRALGTIVGQWRGQLPLIGF